MSIPYLIPSQVTYNLMGHRVLVVDDSLFMRNHIINTLKNIPEIEEIIQAVNGEEALKIYKEKSPDIVTMDVDMPGMNGIDAAQKICLFDFKAKVIMVTSVDQQDKRDLAKKVGAYGYITKPIKREEIIKVINNIQKKIPV